MSYLRHRMFVASADSMRRPDIPSVSDLWRTSDWGNENVDGLYLAVYYYVDGTRMVDMYGGSPITLSEDPGTSYIPYTYSGTIRFPSNSKMIEADQNDNLMFVGSVPKSLSVSDLVSQDYNNILVQYDNVSPYHIRRIGIVNPNFTLTDSDTDRLHEDFDLWWFWSGVFNDYGVLKDNRTL